MNPRHLIDTDWVIHYLDGHPAIMARLDQLADGEIAMSVVSLAELYEGVYSSRDPGGSERAMDNFVSGVAVLGIDATTCRIFGQERGRLRRLGKRPGDFDLLIGATALQHHLTLLTNNRRHFENIDNLVFESA